jgi:spore maturation protein CgeB
MNIVVLGLSLSSSWGNGHATTFRSLISGLRKLGHDVHFLERDVPWYASNRDLPKPSFCRLDYYSSPRDLQQRFSAEIYNADAVIIGSYVPDGIAIIDALRTKARSLCFYDIDTPITLARLEAGDEQYLARRQIPLFDVYFSFTGGPILSRIERDFGARRAAALYCSVDPEMYVFTGETIAWDLGYLGTYSEDRQPTLEKLLIEPARRLPDHRFVVAGPMYPETIEWPANVERIEHLPPARHPSFYSRQRFTLNVTRADMIAAGWSPSVRMFEAAATGVPMISDIWPGLTELLPSPQAVRLARSTDDVVEYLLNTSEPQRRDLAEVAKEIVRDGHTGLARAAQMVTELSRSASRTSGHAPSHFREREPT